MPHQQVQELLLTNLTAAIQKAQNDESLAAEIIGHLKTAKEALQGFHISEEQQKRILTAAVQGSKDLYPASGLSGNENSPIRTCIARGFPKSFEVLVNVNHEQFQSPQYCYGSVHNHVTIMFMLKMKPIFHSIYEKLLQFQLPPTLTSANSTPASSPPISANESKRPIIELSLNADKDEGEKDMQQVTTTAPLLLRMYERGYSSYDVGSRDGDIDDIEVARGMHSMSVSTRGSGRGDHKRHQNHQGTPGSIYGSPGTPGTHKKCSP